MPRWKLAIFDLDGTILNTLGDLTNAVNAAMDRYGFPQWTQAEVRRFIGNGTRALIEHCVPEGTAPDLTERCLLDYRMFYVAHVNGVTRPYPGIVSLFQALRAAGVHIAVSSNKFDSAVQTLIAAHFPGLVDIALGESASVPRKPDPTGARQIMHTLGIDPDDTVYIGDSDVDIQTARNAGVASISVTWGFRDRETLVQDGAMALADDAAALQALILSKAASV